MARHLAIFNDEGIEKILQGEKTVESRFSIAKIPPYQQVKKDDEIYLKKSGGKILGKVLVDNVLYYENLDGEMIGKLRKEYEKDLKTDDNFWQVHAHAHFATIIFLKKPQRFLVPIKNKKHDRRPWVVLES